MQANLFCDMITVGPLLAYSNNNQEHCQLWAGMFQISVRSAYISLGSDVGELSGYDIFFQILYVAYRLKCTFRFLI